MTDEDRYCCSKELNGRRSPLTRFCKARAQPWRMPFLPLVLLADWACEAWRTLRRRRAEARRLGAAAERAQGRIRTLAMYLPQFHRFSENDAWWGEGFTEWTNVRRAQPLYPGHPQPHVPHPDIGYYDLSDVDVMRRQAAMAKRFGLYGFCFYYYHFKDGKRLLDKPLANWLKAGDIDFPFCYAWANENWTRAWDGGDREVIMPQDYGEANMRAMMRNMLEDFRDPRYIKVDGGCTPVLLVYRAEAVPDIRRLAGMWREMARTAGFKNLYLVSMQNFKEIDPAEFGFDAATEFAAWRHEESDWEHPAMNPEDFCVNGRLLNVHRYDSQVRYVLSPDREVPYPRYKMVCPGWDNSPRRGRDAFMLTGNTPDAFGRCVRACRDLTLGDPRLRENAFLFVNAWNEWGEGAHLEPDARNGYAYLESLKGAIS